MGEVGGRPTVTGIVCDVTLGGLPPPPVIPQSSQIDMAKEGPSHSPINGIAEEWDDSLSIEDTFFIFGPSALTHHYSCVVFSLCCLDLSCLVLSCFVLRLWLSCLVLSCLASCRVACVVCLVLSYLVLIFFLVLVLSFGFAVVLSVVFTLLYCLFLRCLLLFLLV